MEQTNILNSVNKLDLILNENLFNKYNQQYTIMQNFISILNSSVYNVHPDFIKCPDYILNDEKCIESIMLNLNKIIHKFNTHVFDNNEEIKNILKKINTVNILISIDKINPNNFHIINDHMKTIKIDINTFIINDNHIKLMQVINNGSEDTEFLLNYIDENY